jgi:hypothetical protein
MPNDLVEAENELSSVLQEKRYVQEHIDVIQQHISKNETWLSMNDPGTVDYQKTLEELIFLQAFVAELHGIFQVKASEVYGAPQEKLVVHLTRLVAVLSTN